MSHVLLVYYMQNNILKLLNIDDLRFKGKWNQLKGKAKQQWGNLTDDDLMYVEGKEDELYGKMQEKTGKSKDEIRKWFDKQMEDLD